MNKNSSDIKAGKSSSPQAAASQDSMTDLGGSSLSSKDIPRANDYSVENEPYLGPAWAVAMLILYLLKQAFPAEQYSVLWWIQAYIITIAMAVTVFTLLKRRQFYQAEKAQQRQDEKASAISD